MPPAHFSTQGRDALEDSVQILPELRALCTEPITVAFRKKPNYLCNKWIALSRQKAQLLLLILAEAIFLLSLHIPVVVAEQNGLKWSRHSGSALEALR